MEAVLDVAEGRLRIPDKAVRRVFAMVRGRRKPVSRQPSNKLTALEREILTLFSSGRSYAEIAEVRGNSTVTVRNNLYRVQDKLGIATKQELVIWAVRNGCSMTLWWVLTLSQPYRGKLSTPVAVNYVDGPQGAGRGIVSRGNTYKQTVLNRVS